MCYYFKNGVELLRKSAKMKEQDTYCAWENVPVEYIKIFVENGQEKKNSGNLWGRCDDNIQKNKI
jgi:hypothetical protein